MSRDFLGQFNVSADLQFTRGIMMLEDCEGSNNWIMAHTGDDSLIELNSDYSLFGTQSLLIQTRDTNAAEDDYCSGSRWIPYPESNLMIFRGKMMIPQIVKSKYIDVFIGYKKVGGAGVTGFRWDVEACTFHVWQTGGSYVALAALDMKPTNLAWVDFEIAVDLGDDRYKYLMLNGVKAESAVVPVTAANATNLREVYVKIVVTALIATACPVHFDSLYVGSYSEV